MRGFIRHSNMKRCPVRIRIDGDAGDAGFSERTDDPDSDLTAISNQDFTETHSSITFG